MLLLYECIALLYVLGRTALVFWDSIVGLKSMFVVPAVTVNL